MTPVLALVDAEAADPSLTLLTALSKSGPAFGGGDSVWGLFLVGASGLSSPAALAAAPLLAGGPNGTPCHAELPSINSLSKLRATGLSSAGVFGGGTDVAIAFAGSAAKVS